MKQRAILLAMVVAAAAATTTAGCSKDEPKAPDPMVDQRPVDPNKPKVTAYHAYDDHADGAALIEAARQKAKAEHKRVLVQFGGNWCTWCAALDHAFAQPDVQPIVDASFVVVHVDSNTNGALDMKYGNLFSNGFPVLLILDADGAVVHVQETGSLERDDKSLGHDTGKVLAFLKQWRG